MLLLTAAVISLTTYTTIHAQSFTLDLNDFRDLYVENPWDTLRTPLNVVYLGEHHTVPNFLSSDFSRQRVIEEYAPNANLKITFRVPLTQRFQSDEVRDGEFIAFSLRPIDAPGVEVTLETVDEIAAARFHSTRNEVWRESVVHSVTALDQDQEEQKGLLNINIPVPLPGAVEKLIGEGDKTNIDISGREQITFAGETRRVSPFYGVEGQQKQPLFPSLDMKQELDVRLQGQIGEKINIQVDHTSSSTLEGQNRIRLNYVGFDDDIIKLIELGNTSLSLPGSPLVSFSTSSKGLFGIKTLAQVGPMDMTVIASKEEGEASRASFTPSGGSLGQTEERTISSLNFVANKYFYLDHPPTPGMGGRFVRPRVGLIDVYRSIQDFEASSRPKTWGIAYVDTFGTGTDIGRGDDFEKRQFEILIPGDDYLFVLDAVTEDVNGIELVRPVSKGEVLAVAYVNVAGDTIGDYAQPASDLEDAPLEFELIWPADPLPTGRFGYTWQYMMRNIYNLGLSNIDASSLELEIAEISIRQNPTTPDSLDVPFIRIFGLDQTDQTGTGPPDSRIDLTSGVVDVSRGLLTFPGLWPFDPDPAQVAAWTINDTLPDGFAFTGPYATLPNTIMYTTAQTNQDFLSSSRFNIIVRGSSTSRTFRIDAFNITEGSEVIKLDGRTLARNRDYNIDYETGEVELTGEVLDQLTPSSNITIDYEYKPFAGGASSTLLGFNSILNLSKSSRIGTTWLYESKASSTTHPRLGEEPTRSVVGGLDANLQYEPKIFTSIVNMLPLVDTDARSSLSVNGGIAISMPDPNTNGEAYIDDMEGVEDSDILSLSRRSWSWASPPVDPEDPTFTQTLSSEKNAGLFWYNIEPDRGVHRRDLNPELDERESTLVPSLEVEFFEPSTDSTEWAGVMAGFRGGLDLSQGQFIEIWVNDFQTKSADRKGVLHLDLGFIDEDFYDPDDNEFNNEDSNRDGFTIGGELNEDTGLDGISTGEAGDDPDDDYISQRIEEDGNRFTRINGTEGNGLLDSEDLDGSGQLETANAYFTYIIDLSDSAVVDVRRDFNPPNDFYTDSLDSWRQYRINLGDYAEIKKDGKPAIEQIKHMRIWFDHISDTVSPRRSRIQICGFKFVGNRWDEDGLRTLADSLVVMPDTLIERFALGVISTKTDPTKYNPPVQPNIQNDIAEKEQSLLVDYENIAPGHSWRIRKRFTGAGLDFSTYQDLNMFVHTDKIDPDLEYFFRMAFDSLTFYEIQIPLTSQFFSDGNWSRVLVDLADFSDLKFEPDDSVVVGTAQDMADPSRTYTVRMVGRPNKPSMFNVRFLYAGLRNKSDRSVTGEVWINDIYLGNRRRDIDTAQRVTGSLNMGNVISLSGSWQQTGADYTPFGQKRGSGTNTNSVSLSAKTSIEHFFPLFGFKVPVTGSFSQNTNLPKFMPNSDTEISDSAVQDSMKSQTTLRGFSTTLTRSGSKNPLLKYSFDKLKANYSMSQSRQKTPSSADTTLTMSGTLDYSITFSGKHRLRLFKNFGIRYWPNSFNYRVNASRTKGQRYRTVGGRLSPDPLVWNAGIGESGSITYVPITSLTSSFRMQTQRDLKLPHEWMGIDIGTETNRNHSFQANYKPPPMFLIKAFSPDINYSAGYREDASPNIQKPGDPNGVRNVSANRDIQPKAQVRHRTIPGQYFWRRGFDGERRSECQPPAKGVGGRSNRYNWDQRRRGRGKRFHKKQTQDKPAFRREESDGNICQHPKDKRVRVATDGELLFANSRAAVAGLPVWPDHE